ncbi:MAG: hypothetical protein Q8L07_13670 [Sediminibacterium sp.]|nr:hypothetical protein [Sediminibacterium sp.]
MKTARQLSIAILLLFFVTASFGSYHMITDPTGNSLGLPFYLLNGSVFTNYYAVGWILLFTVALFSGLVSLLVIRKNWYYSIFIMIQGVIVCMFVFIEWLLLGETFIIQYVFLILGMALIGLGALQNQRKIAVDSEKAAHPQLQPRSHHHKHRKPK